MQTPFLWYLVCLSFSGKLTVSHWPVRRAIVAMVGAVACCVFAAIERDQLLLWGQIAALMCYIGLLQRNKNHEKN